MVACSQPGAKHPLVWSRALRPAGAGGLALYSCLCAACPAPCSALFYSGKASIKYTGELVYVLTTGANFSYPISGNFEQARLGGRRQPAGLSAEAGSVLGHWAQC